jgi:hypothetical protein
MLEFFDGGQRWTRGNMQASNGDRCLAGALQHIRAELRIRGDGTAELFYSLLPAHYPRVFYGQSTPRSLWLLRGLMHFNDRCQSYQDVRRLIVRARRLALAELYRNRSARAHRRLTSRRCEIRRICIARISLKNGSVFERRGRSRRFRMPAPKL